MASNAPQGFTPQHAKVLKADVIPKATIVGESKKLFTNPFDDTPFIHQPVSNYRTDATINYERLKDRNKRIRSLMDLDPRTTEAMLLNIAGAWEAGQIQKQFNDIRGAAIRQGEAKAEKEKKEAQEKVFKDSVSKIYSDKKELAAIHKHHQSDLKKFAVNNDIDGFVKAVQPTINPIRRRGTMSKRITGYFKGKPKGLEGYFHDQYDVNDLHSRKWEDTTGEDGQPIEGAKTILNTIRRNFERIPRVLPLKEYVTLATAYEKYEKQHQELMDDATLQNANPELMKAIQKKMERVAIVLATGREGKLEEIPLVPLTGAESKALEDNLNNAKKIQSELKAQEDANAFDTQGTGSASIKSPKPANTLGEAAKNFLFNQPEGATQPPTKKKLSPKVRQEIDRAEKANPLRKDTGGAIDKVDAFAGGVSGSYVSDKIVDKVLKDAEVEHQDKLQKSKQIKPTKPSKLGKTVGGIVDLVHGIDPLPKVDEPPKPEEEKLELGEWTGKHTKEGRKIYPTNKGWEASEYTIGVKHPQINGGELTHIPSIYGGKIVDQATAEQNIIDNGGKDPETGRYIGPGGDPEARSRSIGEQKKLSTRFVPTAKDRVMDLVMPADDASVGKGVVKLAEEGDPKAKAFMEKLERDYNIVPPLTGGKYYKEDSIGYFEGIGKVYNSIRNKYNEWRKGYQGEDKITTAAQAEAVQKKIRGLTDEQRKNIDRTKRQQSIVSGESDIDTDRTTPRNAFGYGKAPASPEQIKSSFESAYKQSKTQFKKDAVWANIKTENPPLDPNAIGFRLEEDPKTGKMRKKTTKESPNGIPVSYGLAQVRMIAVKDVVRTNPNSVIAGLFKGKKDREIKELLFDPTVNMTVSAMYHELLRKRFRNNKHTKGFSNKDFEDLVVASYNAGPTAISKIIDKAMVKRSSINMKSLYVYLPRETQLHVDKFRINRTK
jgi:hypothetical protein